MSVEVRNLQTGETYAVGNDGAIFGREGGGAAIQVADRSVSKKHARVFTDGTEWFLEDMGSVNGTVVDGNKIGGAVPLRAGLVFALSKFKFEILRVPAAYNSTPDVETRTSMRKNANNAQDLPSELRKDPIPRKRSRDLAPPRAAEEQAYDDDYNQPPPTHRNQNLPLASDNDFPSQAPRVRHDQHDDQHDGQAPVLGIDQYEELAPAEAATMGIGYVLKTTPLLAFNPIGTVRNHIERPPLPALEKVPLAALLAPALAVTVTIQSGAGALAALILGGSFVGVIVAPVIGVIAGVIGALIAGFLSHPILGWLVDKLGGSSDARSRTAHVGIGVVANVVLLVPNVLSVVLVAVIAKLATVSAVFSLLLIIPALISLVATPLPIYIQWQFFKSYGVAKWFQTLLLVVMVLALVGGLYSSVMVIVSAVKGMSGGATVVAVDGVTPPADGTVPPVTPPDGDDAPSGDVKPATDTKPTTPPATDTKPTTPVTTTTTTTPPVTNTPPVTTPTTPTKPPVTTPATKVTIDEDYATFERKRAEIEAVLERDPTIVVRDPRVAKLYETFLTRADEAENMVFQRFNGKKRPSALNPLYEKAKKAEVYDKTKVDVNQLHRSLFGGN